MMKLQSKPLCALAFALLGTLAAASSAQAITLEQVKERGVIRVAVANEIPYGYMDMSGKAQGAGPEVAQAIMERLGVKEIKWETANFGSLIPGLQAKRFDMVAAEMAILPQRCNTVLFSEPNSSYGEGLLVAKGNPKNIHSYEDFAKTDHKIAIMAGADQLEMMQALGVPDNRMITISNNADAISTVATGRADAYAATGQTASDLASKGGGKVELAAEFKDPIIDGNPVRSWGGFAFAKESEDLRDAVNKELAEFKKTDEWKAILSKHGFTEEDAKHSFEKSTEQLCKA
ncbi:ectoine/hydroxyectoine ABC transporter substrate-binding protein EhuB [Alcaligenes nematophilus]|uniref:Ectoine/hydroxyectoine ABC transporter substrate-binding protein EhuB n=2 Tax=Alcaligenes TaxID=507 RepID=A0ABU3MRJ2_9BURK|nr:ectoine/hydroxyectoine ABC transporter substrate-binding protein EhuB [Alcaligenes nematophilus]MDT8464651.1 ectoine/hydroxyectoine ABC transporter substrate-binding protein EhuB [Alcaligenes nematophilus]MDT8467459.1 ectoine/hydroxyectoine ABC transporter substrate-binding protein EhuB [Alcaligenes nematophilus]MDT8503935.1 ectoine/hydroxyectoine ABC transporter substrate-binding protein EhuB [Alcaligenes nematophilus]MDT8523818.1 ectoine/hydroxyectoine ABC transporter substrate-binding pro